MDVLRVLKFVLGSIQFVTGLTKEDMRLSGQLKNGLDFIKQELEMIQGYIEKHEDEGLQLQELAYDIEDFIYGLWVPGASGPILTAIGLDPRQEDIHRIDHFKERIKRLQEWQSGGCTVRPDPSGSGSPSYTPEDELVGIAEPKRELLELLSIADGQPRQLRVISIVGCRGLGKTALARAVYNHFAASIPDPFDCVKWVVASECNDAEGLVNKILQQVRPAAAGETTSHVKQPITELHDILKDNRYLLVIDDMQQAEMWNHIQPAFPGSDDKICRIIVTTSVHSVANACSSGRGSCVYTMRGLDDACSEQLFWRKVYGPEAAKPAPAMVDGRKVYGPEAVKPEPALACGSKSIFLKCGGLPLALISAANYLGGRQGQIPRRHDCEVLGQALGDYLAGNEPAFGKMKRALVQCYDSLPDYGHKTCLLSLSIFPRGHRMNRKSLVRRWIAEELVVGSVQLNKEQIACQCLEKLIDGSIIEPVPICNGSNKVVPIMLEFTIHKSVSKNFVTLIHENKLLRKDSTYHVRRLSVQSSPQMDCHGLANGNGLCALRSLTIFGNDLLNFQECKLLRVLDLESCRGLDERVLDDICDFQFLKYLSLRGSDVPRIPTRIEKLYNLETLDIRETRVGMLPVEVIMLPNLVYLLGKFELPPSPHTPGENESLNNFLLNKSKLHTIAGFVINRTQGFENVLHARMLKKVKVWFEDTTTPALSSTPPAPSSIRSFGHNIASYFRAAHKRIRTLGNCRRPMGSPERNPSTEDPPLPSRGFARSQQNEPITSELTRKLVSTLQRRFTALESVSIDSSDLSKAFLGSLNATCAISSIKLRGELQSLPDSTKLNELRNLNKLHLLSTGLSSEKLSVLQYLGCLQYLTLAEDRDGFSGSSFVVHRDGFPSLRRLCFEAPKLPLVKIEQEAMTELTSLWLLCHEFADAADGLGVTGIEHLQRLDEVILCSSVSDAVMEAWKRAAIQHQNRPSVKKQQINDAA